MWQLETAMNECLLGVQCLEENDWSGCAGIWFEEIERGYED